MTAHNLPVELTRFVGRGAELGDLEALVASRRLVTLAGVGGCGKTRLAARLARRWPDGAWLVDLGPVTDPEQVPRLAAATLGVLIEPGGDPVQSFAAQLRHRRLLLCLDTCEHLIDAVAALAETVLRTCPDVSILATSREPLGVEGETVWRVPSLKEDEAVELFVDRASLAAPGFDLHTTQTDVRAVCSRVDNIPLAVELAAAWVRALTPAQIASGLDDRFRLLAGGPRRAIPRHQTLQASMAWSHALLEDDEKLVFRRMAVFSGNFTLEAVEAVCGGSLAVLGRLVDKSLVVVREAEDRVHYRLLDTVRQYAQEELRASGEADAIQDRHLDHYLARAEDAQTGLETDQDRWRQELRSQQDNINAALDWGLARPGDRGRRLAAAMARQWFICGQAHVGLEFLRRALEVDSGGRPGLDEMPLVTAAPPSGVGRDDVLQGRLLAATALLSMVSGRVELLERTVSLGLELAGETGDEVSRGRCLAALSYRWFFEDFQRCHDIALEAAEVAGAAGDPFARDWATMVAAYTFTTRNRHPEAVALARAAYARSHPRGDRFCAAMARGVELWAALETGDVRTAAAIGAEVVELAVPLGDYFAIGTLTSNLAQVNGLLGNIASGLKMMDGIVRSIDEAADVDAVGFEPTIGTLHLWDGDLDDAVRWFERGIARVGEREKDWTASRCHPVLAAALRRLGRLEEAAVYAARAVALGEAHESPYLVADGLDEQAFLVAGTDPGRARDLHHEALALRRELGLRTYLVRSVDALALLEAGVGNDAEAVRLLAAAEAARAVVGHPRPPVEHAEFEAVGAGLRARLGAEFEVLWQDGASRSLDDVVAAVTRGRGPRNRPHSGWASLTPAELDVVALIREGLPNPEIASRLYVSRGTVKAHLTHIYAKLGVTNRTELALVAASRDQQ